MPRKSRLHAILLDMMSRYLADGEPIAEGFFDSGVVFALVMRMHFVTMLGCVVGIGALCDYDGDHHGLVIGIQIALGIIGFRGFVKMVGPE